MIEEVWKDAIYIKNNGEVIDFDGWYQVSNKGRIRTFRQRTGGNGVSNQRSNVPIIMKNKNGKGNYVRLTMRIYGKVYNISLHRLVISTFVPIPEHLKNEKIIDVNHLDEDKENNDLSNLEWCSRLDNNTHGTRLKRAIKNGLKTKSTVEWKEKNPSYKRSNARKVVGVNVKTGCVVELNSMNCADEYFNIPFAGRSISATIRGRQKTAYGHRWYYKEDYEKQ